MRRRRRDEDALQELSPRRYLQRRNPRPNKVTESVSKLAEGFAMLHGYASNEEECYWD